MQSVRSPICQQSASGPLRPHNRALPHFAFSSTHIACPHAPSCPQKCTPLHCDFATGINIYIKKQIMCLSLSESDLC